ncbi:MULTISPECIES: Fur family transcriptional regulator [unclassified Desulfovibrio]|uniref:Fur family transcriptional regulator n=1 Tax=unclassified Desulfovibrio TaxID=2593640 RepID=UPI000F5FAC74|nr:MULTISPECIES: transcriptional repressor [unclassified Desulfovibrio]RRD70204.1 transcriptional repressor [Desulfovibrio sp. OH1209_COT-279]RRD86726.1 transcriptional repressor [Desulfovibrio sp. OH1186_COT-070]
MTEAQQAGVKDFLAFMGRKGLNTTTQRRVIAEAFFNLPGHHSLEEFYQHIFQKDPGIGQTTVYRTLKLLCEAGLAMETHFSDGITRYEIVNPNSHHDHLVCLDCGKIVEVFDPQIEKIQRAIAKKHDFALRGHVHNLYGLCADCRKTESKRLG